MQKTRKQALDDARAAVGLIAEDVRVVPPDKKTNPCYVLVVGFSMKIPSRSDYQRVLNRLTRTGWEQAQDTETFPDRAGKSYSTRHVAGDWKVRSMARPITGPAKRKTEPYRGMVFVRGLARRCDKFDPGPEPTTYGSGPAQRPTLPY